VTTNAFGFRPTRRLLDLLGWIAFNDNSGNGDNVREISEYITTTMLAHTYNIAPMKLANFIAEVRRRAGIGVGE